MAKRRQARYRWSREEGQVNSVKMAERISLASVLSLLAIPLTLGVGIAISLYNPLYAVIVAGALVVGIILLLRQDEFVVMLIVAVHILVDAYLGFAVYQIALLMALILLAVCYLGRSADRPWSRPRLLWLWLLFLILTIFPTLKGGVFSLTNSIGFYLEIVLSPFVMFWLGNVIAKDMSAMRRVFQFLAIMAAIFAIHTIIEANTGIFLFESARAKANLFQATNFQLGNGATSRVGSFFGNPNGNGIFLATSFFLPLGLFIESKQFWAKMTYLLEMLAILLALMYTYSNGSWVAALVGLVAFMFLVGHVRYSVLLCLFMLALAAIAFVVFPSQIAVQISHARDQGDLSLHFADWQTALRVIAAYPLFGVGLGSQAYLTLSNPYRVLAQTKPLAEPDNSYLQWGAMAGIPVMLLFLLMLGIVFWFSWRNWLSVEARYRPLLAGGIVALIALSVNSLSVDGWTSPIDVQFLGWLIAGVVTSPFIGCCLSRRPQPAIDRMAESGHSQFGVPWIDKARQEV